MLNPISFPRPNVELRMPPIKEPDMPTIIVTIIPPGSLPGSMNFANVPTISPITIHEIIPIYLTLHIEQIFSHRIMIKKEFIT